MNRIEGNKTQACNDLSNNCHFHVEYNNKCTETHFKHTYNTLVFFTNQLK